ncbi:MAG: methyltransferase domain-containing protein [Ktedonobacteraceae bacterium]|nr:methyltransferase domain-containing protein [Ktedonobacteraceae bacterium]
MLTSPQSETRRHALVAALRESGAIHAPAIAEAFLSIPRELFIDHIYERDGRGWKRREKRDPLDEWLDLIYRDDALTTAVNRHNIPLSSSSQPSLMAHMLEALEVQPGQRVLEIGTGTGYNAALLAQIVGESGHVASLDIDASLVERARSHLAAAGFSCVQAMHADGRQGHAGQAPYDRIIATASSSCLPCAWYEQLAPGGRLVMPLEGSLQVGGFLVIEKEDEVVGRGMFRSTPLHFMALHTEGEEIRPYPEMPPDFPQKPVTTLVQVKANDPFLADVGNHAFKWYVQWAWPVEGELRITTMQSPDGKEALRLYDVNVHSIVHLVKNPDGSWNGHQRGDFPLWAQIYHLYHSYQDLGRPAPDAFRIHLESQRASLFVSHGDTSVYVRDLFGM